MDLDALGLDVLGRPASGAGISTRRRLRAWRAMSRQAPRVFVRYAGRCHGRQLPGVLPGRVHPPSSSVPWGWPPAAVFGGSAARWRQPAGPGPGLHQDNLISGALHGRPGVRKHEADGRFRDTLYKVGTSRNTTSRCGRRRRARHGRLGRPGVRPRTRGSRPTIRRERLLGLAPPQTTRTKPDGHTPTGQLLAWARSASSCLVTTRLRVLPQSCPAPAISPR